jgi:hypothetical protein
LRAWVNEDREFLLWRERLGALLKEWNRAKENETLYYEDRSLSKRKSGLISGSKISRGGN